MLLFSILGSYSLLYWRSTTNNSDFDLFNVDQTILAPCLSLKVEVCTYPQVMTNYKIHYSSSLKHIVGQWGTYLIVLGVSLPVLYKSKINTVKIFNSKGLFTASSGKRKKQNLLSNFRSLSLKIKKNVEWTNHYKKMFKLFACICSLKTTRRQHEQILNPVSVRL